MATRRLGAELLVLAIALGGCGRSAPSAESAAAPAVPVRVVTARARTVDRTVDIVGALVANQEAKLAAEVDGQVKEVLVDLGDRVKAGQVLVRIDADLPAASLREAEVRYRNGVGDAERVVPEIQVGQEVHGEVDAFPGLTVRGRVARLNAALDSKNRSLTLEAEIDNSDGRLRPGFFVRGTVLTQRGITTVSVPASVVQSFAGVSHVYVLSDNVARSREIQLGSRFEDDVEIVS